MNGELSLKVETLEQFVNVCLIGEVDIYTSQQFKDQLYNIIDSNKKDLKIDCKELKYIDSTGLGIFVGALKRAKENENKIYLSNLKENIKKLFVITGLDKIFIIEQ